MSVPTELKKITDLLKRGCKVIFLVGAGISTSAGIPDFRSPETGLYHNLQKLDLPYAEAVFDIEFFRENPKPFAHLARELYPGQFTPTRFHYLIKLVESKQLLKRVYTQNIDTLERVAGVSDEFVVEAHGSFAGNHCIECHEEFDGEKYKELVFKQEQPLCEKCQGLVKPDIVFFGEGLPAKFFDLWDDDSAEMEDHEEEGEFVTITAGTSLTVYPFAQLPADVPKSQLRVLVNMENVGDFKQYPRKSDIVFLQSTDKFAEELCDALGWREELDKLVEEGQKKIRGQKETKEEVTEHIVADVKEALSETSDLKTHEEKKKKDDALSDLTSKLEDLKVDASKESATQ